MPVSSLTIGDQEFSIKHASILVIDGLHTAVAVNQVDASMLLFHYLGLVTGDQITTERGPSEPVNSYSRRVYDAVMAIKGAEFWTIKRQADTILLESFALLPPMLDKDEVEEARENLGPGEVTKPSAGDSSPPSTAETSGNGTP